MNRFLRIGKNALRPGYAPVMARKALGRLRGDARRRAAAIEWARPQAVAIPEWCAGRDAVLWDEAKEYGAGLRARATALGEQLGVEIGGGARAELLYFVTRRLRPRVVVETGVLHGFSSAAVLAALDRNGDGGRLLSSDFPYFREADPERLIGVLVPDEHRDRWTVLLKGDRDNLPKLLAEIDRIDMFHYDSDKTYAGRAFAMRLVEPLLSDAAAVLMDDIQDNLFFRDWSRRRSRRANVLGGGAAFVGVWGLD